MKFIQSQKSELQSCSDFYSEREIVPVETVCGDLGFPRENVQSVLSEKYNLLIDTISKDEVTSTEEQTREQAQCEKWFKERENRITASYFHRIVKRKAAITEKFILSIMKPKPFTSKATSYGRNNELKARNLYVQTAGHHVHDCGFVINPRYPFIGATPDAKICDNGVTGIMEIKCPFSQRENLITDAMQGADFCLELSENGPRLKSNHDYFIQVQGQLLVTGSQFCDFVVYTKKDIHIERIYPDKAVMQDILDKLADFYFEHVHF
ncbi:unnamed protein product [Mytilus coruscus]|uniref:YqaJ viral recombinase domain-containing protein n=1 Tax=Mytilus coruscus TaxID=42192 RepID=A0A6J8DUW2_MYTCO|nr:unnamed protein product [Mytilus coruscus]